MFRTEESKIHVMVHQANETEYLKCFTLDIPQYYLNDFFVMLYAKSEEKSRLSFNVNNLTFSTYTENMNIEEYPPKYDPNLPKLFKSISFLAKNKEMF